MKTWLRGLFSALLLGCCTLAHAIDYSLLRYVL